MADSTTEAAAAQKPDPMALLAMVANGNHPVQQGVGNLQQLAGNNGVMNRIGMAFNTVAGIASSLVLIHVTAQQFGYDKGIKPVVDGAVNFGKVAMNTGKTHITPEKISEGVEIVKNLAERMGLEPVKNAVRNFGEKFDVPSGENAIETLRNGVDTVKKAAQQLGVMNKN